MKVLKKIFLFLFILFALFYLGFLFLIPKLVSQNGALTVYAADFLSKKYNISADFEGLKFKSYPNLSFVVYLDSLSLKKEGKFFLDIKNLETGVDIKRGKIKKTSANYILYDSFLFEEEKESKKSKPFLFDKIPEIFVKKAEFVCKKQTKEKYLLDIENLEIKNENNKKVANFNLKLDASNLKKSVNINNGRVILDNNKLFADNLEILIDNISLFIDGRLYDSKDGYSFNIKGENLLVDDVFKLYYTISKLKKKDKLFVENFEDFSGKINLDLKFTNSFVYGKLFSKNLCAKTVLYGVPLKFENFTVNFDGQSLEAKEKGLFGGEVVEFNIKSENLFTKNLSTKGSLSTVLSPKFHYIPNLSIKDGARVSVNFATKNKISDIEYFLKLDKDSDIFYKDANLGYADFDRKLYVKTKKENDNLYIESYDYSSKNDGKYNKIIEGDGLLKKENNAFVLKYITCKTNEPAPASVAGSFGRYITGGVFDGNLKYDDDKSQITGDFTIKNARHKAYLVEEAKILADEENIFILAKGKYKKSDFECKIKAKNNIFDKKLSIDDMYLFLDNFIYMNGSGKRNKIDIKKFKNKNNELRNFDAEIKKWTIKINKVQKEKIVFEDILVEGSLTDNVFEFSTSDIKFAEGILNGVGKYDFNTNSSEIDFLAENINSNIVASSIFGLDNQIEGKASANMHFLAGKNLENIKANVNFSVSEGYLPKVGTKEFMIKRPKRLIKFRLSDIIKTDTKNMKEIASSDIKGNFDVNNQTLENLHIKTKQKYAAFILEGKYNFMVQDGELDMFGKYNEQTARGVKILFVPLSFILKTVFRQKESMELHKEKFEQIPKIESEGQQERAFRIKLKGNVNDNSVKVELKNVI